MRRGGRRVARLRFLLGAALAAGVASAPGSALAERVALVVGNGAYDHTSRLPNPGNDAQDVSAALRRLGFEVTPVLDADKTAMTTALADFSDRSRGAEVALVFYAGHGLEMDGVNYLVPVDARLERDTRVRFEAVLLDDVLASAAGAGLRVVILDACRNNPLARSMQRTVPTRSVSGGSFRALDEELLEGQTLVAYSAAAGTVAEDGDGRNSPYASALLLHLETAVEIGILFRRVRASVLALTDGRQRPHEYMSLLGEHYLSGAIGGTMGSVPPADPPDAVVDDAGPGRRDGEVFRDDCPACPEMVVIPAGEFTMGSPASEAGRDDDEGPQRRVRVGRFALGRYEVTRAEYAAFVAAMGRDDEGRGCYVAGNGDWVWSGGATWRSPGFRQTDDHPAVCVSRDDALAYVSWLHLETGHEYRLPSESEWEYAARGGTSSSRYWGEGASSQCLYANGADASVRRRFAGREVASCDDRRVYTAPVGTFTANRFGLFDMLGNVWEWVEDCWNFYHVGAPTDGRAITSGFGVGCGRRVSRGGSWNDAPRYLRAANRGYLGTGDRYEDRGFRVARTLTLD